LGDWFIAKLNENTEISDFKQKEDWDDIGSPFTVYERECELILLTVILGLWM